MPPSVQLLTFLVDPTLSSGKYHPLEQTAVDWFAARKRWPILMPHAVEPNQTSNVLFRVYLERVAFISSLSFATLLILGSLIRLLLIFYGSYHDSVHALKYTDIDYEVFTDAASFILHPSTPAPGPLAQSLSSRSSSFRLRLGTPYDRATYRYTPLLALLMLPNIVIHPLSGKFLFLAADLIVAALLYHILSIQQRVPAQQAKLYVCTTWLFNPFVANISTRGSAESLLGALVLGTLALANGAHWRGAAICYGAAVHLKLYPVIYASSILAVLASYSRSWINAKQVEFVVISFGSFMVLNVAMYSMCVTAISHVKVCL